MPRVMRQVEEEVSVGDLNQDLAGSLGEIDQGGVFLPGEGGERGEEINEGDFLVPTEEARNAMQMVPESCVYVVTTVPAAGIFWGAFHRVPGGKGVQFFNGTSFIGKYQDVAPVQAKRSANRLPAKVPAKRGRKPRQQ